MEIPDKELFRIVTLTNGMYKGEYRIYWNRYIYEKLEPGSRLYKWGDCSKSLAGDWVETYDGTCIQILDKRPYTAKNGSRTHHFYRFATATVYSWTLHKTGITKYRQFQGNFMTAGRHSLKMTTMKGNDHQKVRFASFLANGINPLKAYRIAFNFSVTLDIVSLHRRVNQMIGDKVVQKELVVQIAPLVEQLSEEFPDDSIVLELKTLLDSSKPGSADHRENLKFIMNLLGKLPERITGGRKQKLVEQAEYEDLEPPPQLTEGAKA